MRIRFFLPFSVACAALFFAACNGDDDSPDATATPGDGGGQPTATAGAGETPQVETGTTPGPFRGSTNAVEVAPPPGAQQPLLRTMRAAAQAGYDRLVFEFDGNHLPGYSIKYADEAIACGSGADLTDFVGGGSAPEALILVRLEPSVAHTEAGSPTAPRDLSPALDSLERVFRICDFEGVVTYAVALSDEQPFRVTTLTGPTRLVLDIGQ